MELRMDGLAWIAVKTPGTTQRLHLDTVQMIGKPVEYHIQAEEECVRIRNVTMFAGQISPFKMLKLSLSRIIRGKKSW